MHTSLAELSRALIFGVVVLTTRLLFTDVLQFKWTKNRLTVEVPPTLLTGCNCLRRRLSSKWKVTQWKSVNTSAFLVSYSDRVQATSAKRVFGDFIPIDSASSPKRRKRKSLCQSCHSVFLALIMRSRLLRQHRVIGCWRRAKGCFGKNRRSPRRQPRVPC